MNNQQQEIVFALEKWFAAHQKVAIAFSGGVDSSLLFFLGSRVLGDNCRGIFANSMLMSRMQIESAKSFARSNNFIFEEIRFSPLDVPGFSQNSNDRCYICKKALYENLKKSLAPGWHLADGTNLDDNPDERPGFQAIRELGVATPFLSCGIGKAQIRDVSQALGLSCWDKPSDSCLATRIPRDIVISQAVLQKIEEVEADLRELGFEGMRASIQDDKILLTFKEGDLQRALLPEMRRNIQKIMAEHSFSKVFLDLSERPGILASNAYSTGYKRDSPIKEYSKKLS